MAAVAGRTSAATELQEKAAALAEEHRVPGVSAGILHDGEEHYAYHGVTSLENPLNVDESTLFQIGSTTKTYTATVIMRLVDEGRVRLDERVRTYVPEFTVQDEDAAAAVTVLQILNHTAGWAGDFFADTGAGDDALARYVARMAELAQVNPPGTIASYNNAAFSLAGRLIEKVTGTTYEQAVKDLLLDPVGLDESYFFGGDVMTRRFAVGHTLREREDRVAVARPVLLPRSAAPAGGIWATARDQVRYARFHLGDGTGGGGARVLTGESLELMRVPTFSLEGGALGDAVGISWMIRDAGGVRLVSHGGGTNGQISAFSIVPERGFAVAVLTNSSKGQELQQELVRWALERFLGVSEAEPEPLHLDEAALREFCGAYRSDTSVVEVSAGDARLLVSLGYTEEGLQQYRTVSDEPPEVPPPFAIGLIGDDRYTVLDGPFRGIKGNFVRRDGRVSGVNLGGRLAVRQ